MQRYIFIFISLMVLPLMGLAQGSTSATIQGFITDSQGEPLPGANIVATHQPTGTTFGTSSRANGRYTLKNLRVGGPYLIEVTFVGFNAQKKEVARITLDETLEIDFELEEGQLELDEISIVAQADPIFNSDRTGASNNISTAEIEQNPSITRSISDFVRLVPQSTGTGSQISFVGVNNRFNNILVDGATLNDVFGLSGTGAPGGQAGAQPISLDAVEQFNVDIAPYDVTNNNFTGGQVNLVTRSGTNKFKGSAYFKGRSDRFVGDLDDSGIGEFDESFGGFRLGGPIIEDKLFFFVNAEFKRESAPLTAGILGSGEPTIFPVPQSTFDEIRNIALEEYNHDPGTTDPLSQDQDNNKVLAKLDWNINEDNRFTFRYNRVNADDEEGIGRFSDEFDFSNREWIFNSVQNSFVAELKTTVNDNMFNEARAVYTRIRDQRDVVAEPFPEVSIILDDGNQINMGIDRFSQANRLDQDIFEFTNNLTYLKGDHEFTLGTSNQIFSFDNLFIQDFWGAYEFTSVEDPNNPGTEISAIEAFRRGIPSEFLLSFSRTDEEKPTADWTGLQLGFYAQDKWRLRDDFTLTLGFRFDLPLFPDDPLFNPDVPDAFPGFSTSEIPTANVLLSPRVGFNWKVTEGERATQLRGGTGIFAGAPPFVWLSNLYSNTGADFARVDVDGEPIREDGFFSPDPLNQPRPGGNALVETTEINLADDDFKLPQTWRSNLGIDHVLPFGFLATGEFIFSKDLNAVTFRNINLESTGVTQNGRVLYGEARTFGSDRNIVDDRFTNAIVLDNVDKGFNYSLTGRLQKQTEFGLSGSVAYTFNQAKNVNNATSSRAISNWQFNEARDINNPEKGISDFRIKNRVLATLTYANKGTEISFVYEGRSGQPFTWIYFGDANADGQSFNDPIFIPETQDDIILTSNNWEALDSFIESRESLRENRGEIAKRNAATAPWRNILDVKVSQDIPAVTKGRLSLELEMLNFLNLLDSDWGAVEFTSFNTVNALGFEGHDPATGKPIVNFNDGSFDEENEFLDQANLSSRWQLQVGLRYTF